jgi:hypothetical protein
VGLAAAAAKEKEEEQQQHIAPGVSGRSWVVLQKLACPKAK